jgi:integrase
MTTLPNAARTVDDALARYLERFERRVATGARSAATLTMHRAHAELIRRALPAGVQLLDVRGHLEQLAGADVSGGTVRKRLSTLFGALDLAHRRGELAELPPRPEVDYRYVPGQAHLRTFAEYRALLSQLPPRRRPWVAAGVLTGMHASCLDGWRAYVDADPFEGWMVLRNTKNRRTGLRVRMPRELARHLKIVFIGLDAGDRIFPAWSHSARWRTLAAASRRAGLERLNPTALRHTCGTWLVRRVGITPASARWMGHRSTTMMERVYAHALPLQLLELTAELDSMEDAGAARCPPQKVSRKRVGNPLPRRGAGSSGDGGAGNSSVPEKRLRGTAQQAQGSDRSSERRGSKAVPRDRVELSTHGFSVPSPLAAASDPCDASRSLSGRREEPPCPPTPGTSSRSPSPSPKHRRPH